MLATTFLKHLITGMMEITDLNRRMGPPVKKNIISCPLPGGQKGLLH
jgi:hypothetical protein